MHKTEKEQIIFKTHNQQIDYFKNSRNRQFIENISIRQFTEIFKIAKQSLKIFCWKEFILDKTSFYLSPMQIQ